jgi:hypothetical protein
MGDLPERLQPRWMPYDARLDDKSKGYAGTESDFPQRAVHHFVKNILAVSPRGDAATHHDAVLSALRGFRAPKRKRGISMSDEELLKVIRRMWKRLGGHRTAMLRELRDVQDIACEQSRFRRLANQIAEEFNAKDK